MSTSRQRSTPATFEATAQLLEDMGVSAYLGQVANIKTPAIAAAAGTIVTVEARHAAWMRHIRKVAPAPLAFDKPKTMAQILAALGKTGTLKYVPSSAGRLAVPLARGVPMLTVSALGEAVSAPGGGGGGGGAGRRRSTY